MDAIHFSGRREGEGYRLIEEHGGAVSMGVIKGFSAERRTQILHQLIVIFTAAWV